MLQIDAINTQADVVQGRVNMLLVQAGEAQADGPVQPGAVTDSAMADGVSVLLSLPASAQAHANVETARQAYYDYLTTGPENKAGAYDKAVRLLGESIGAALENPSLDVEMRVALEEMLENIDSKRGMGDNKGEKQATGSKTEIELTEPTLPQGSKPKGNYATPDANDPRPIVRQNESADLLAGQGYDVTMLPEITDGNGYGIDPRANPDFLIGPESFDCYAPNSMSVRNIWSTVVDKTISQSGRIVLNLDDYSGSMDALYSQFMEWRIEMLSELLIIKGGHIIRWIP